MYDVTLTDSEELSVIPAAPLHVLAEAIVLAHLIAEWNHAKRTMMHYGSISSLVLRCERHRLPKALPSSQR